MVEKNAIIQEVYKKKKAIQAAMFIAMTDSIPPSETNIIHVHINTRASFKDVAIKVFEGRTVLYYQLMS